MTLVDQLDALRAKLIADLAAAVLPGYLGETFGHHDARVKRVERARFEAEVTPLERA